MVYATSSAEKGVPSEYFNPSRSLNRIRLPPSDTFHDVARSGSAFKVSRLTRTRTPPVRYRMVSDASSSTSSGLNVLGSERRQKRSSPPLWANTEIAQSSKTAEIK